MCRAQLERTKSDCRISLSLRDFTIGRCQWCPTTPTWSGLRPGGTHVYSSRAHPESSSLWLCLARSVCPPPPPAVPLTSLPIPSSFTSPDIASDSAASTFLKSKIAISGWEVICDLSGDRPLVGGAGDWVMSNPVSNNNNRSLQCHRPSHPSARITSNEGWVPVRSRHVGTDAAN